MEVAFGYIVLQHQKTRHKTRRPAIEYTSGWPVDVGILIRVHVNQISKFGTGVSGKDGLSVVPRSVII